MEKIIVKEVEIHRFKRYRDKTIHIPEGFCLLAGSNNSGKSSFLQACAIWEFCKSVIQLEQGIETFYEVNIGKKQGVGINSDDFLPINVPSLKHLWTNLKVNPEENNGVTELDGYTLWIELKWKVEGQSEIKHIRFSLSLANERLFIKTTKSNLKPLDLIPKIAYIPSFAGILNREPFHTKAMRSRLIGQGLSGSVMRNTLLELSNKNKENRVSLKGDKPRISRAQLKELRSGDRWEHLLEVTRRLFNIEMIVQEFNAEYHSYIQVEYWKGAYNESKTKFEKYPNFNRRDIMVEGSGFLQLLNVISLALDPTYQIIFLDEPDAHLHPKLQFELLNELKSLSKKYNKQILFATHSTELIASQSPENIMKFEDGKVQVLTENSQKIGLILGLGSEYSPILHTLQRTKKVWFVENESDSTLLKYLAETLNTPIPSDIVIWPWSGGHKDRLHLFLQLKREINGLKGISLRDRDSQSFASITVNLLDKEYPTCDSEGMLARTWRYRYIETYLLNVAAIARTAKVTEQEVNDHAKVFGIDLTRNDSSDIYPALKDIESKPILTEGQNCFSNKFSITKYEIAKQMNASEIHKDIITFINEIRLM